MITRKNGLLSGFLRAKQIQLVALRCAVIRDEIVKSYFQLSIKRLAMLCWPSSPTPVSRFSRPDTVM